MVKVSFICSTFKVGRFVAQPAIKSAIAGKRNSSDGRGSRQADVGMFIHFLLPDPSTGLNYFRCGKIRLPWTFSPLTPALSPLRGEGAAITGLVFEAKVRARTLLAA